MSAAVPPPPTDGPFAELFTKDKSVVYITTDEVDPHDASPGKRQTIVQTARVTLTVKTVELDAGTCLAEGVWAPVADPSSTVLDGGAPPTSWRLRGEDLERGDDTDHLVLISASALRAAPRQRATCHRKTDSGNYGPTLLELCFDAAGLVRYEEQNLHGPRRFTLVRARR